MAIKIDLTGQQFGNWIVLEELGGGKVLCECQCKNKTQKILYKKAVKEGKTKSCGCLKGQLHIKSVVGQKFGHWTVLEELGAGKVLCQCDCKNKTVREVYKQALKDGKSKSCGCEDFRLNSVTPGEMIGNWKVIKQLDSAKCLVECQCEKHTTQEMYITNLKRMIHKDCGCGERGLLREHVHVGDTFGNWKVLEVQTSGALCECQCKDKTTKILSFRDLVRGYSKSCGCLASEFRNETHMQDIEENYGEYIGKKFGEFTIIGFDKGINSCICECSCEDKSKRIYPLKYLIEGRVKSCGCKAFEYSKQTSLSRYGDTIVSRANSPREKWQIEAISSKENMEKIIKTKFLELPRVHVLADYLNISDAHLMRILRKYELTNLVVIRPSVSKFEEDVYDFLKSVYTGEIRYNVRDIINPYELDIYIPELKLAIECNGDYWHSTAFIESDYHLNKTKLCYKNGIRLIHIFEYEWNNSTKQNIIKGLISNVIGAYISIYARNTEIKLISNSDAKLFLDKNHLQGSINCEYNIALLYNNQIVQLLSLSKPRFDKTAEYEIVRVCSLIGYRVIGGLDKLLKYAKERLSIKGLISYVDIAKFDGKSYNKGFKRIAITDPGYVWVKNDIVLSRYQTQKHKLIEAGLGTEEQTEDDIMYKLGFYKIYNCGNIKYLWEGDK